MKRGQNLIPQQRSQRIRSQGLFGWLERWLKVEIVPMDAIADALVVVLFFHHFILIVILTGN